MIRLELTGRPTGKGRPRFGRGGVVFTPHATKLAEGQPLFDPVRGPRIALPPGWRWVP